MQWLPIKVRGNRDVIKISPLKPLGPLGEKWRQQVSSRQPARIRQPLPGLWADAPRCESVRAAGLRDWNLAHVFLLFYCSLG